MPALISWHLKSSSILLQASRTRARLRANLHSNLLAVYSQQKFFRCAGLTRWRPAAQGTFLAGRRALEKWLEKCVRAESTQLVALDSKIKARCANAAGNTSARLARTSAPSRRAARRRSQATCCASSSCAPLPPPCAAPEPPAPRPTPCAAPRPTPVGPRSRDPDACARLIAAGATRPPWPSCAPRRPGACSSRSSTTSARARQPRSSPCACRAAPPPSPPPSPPPPPPAQGRRAPRKQARK